MRLQIRALLLVVLTMLVVLGGPPAAPNVVAVDGLRADAPGEAAAERDETFKATLTNPIGGAKIDTIVITIGNYDPGVPVPGMTVWGPVALCWV